MRSLSLFLSNRVSGDDKKHRLQIAKSHENGMARRRGAWEGEGGLKVEGRGEEMEEERVRIKGNGHYLHRSRLTILHRPSRSRPSPTAIPELGWNSRLRSFVRSFVRSFELVRAKTHGNSSVYGGKRRIVKCGQARPTDIGERMRE